MNTEPERTQESTAFDSATRAEQVQLSRLHDEFPILNDLEAAVSFSIPEGTSTPQHLAWKVSQNVYQHLCQLGVAERIQRIIRAMALHKLASANTYISRGKVEFNHGAVAIHWG